MKTAIPFIFILFLSACASNKSLETVDNLNLKKYSGTWYEIARFDHAFESELTCVRAEYSLNDDGTVKVINSGHKKKDRSIIDMQQGEAWVPDSAEPGQLKVQFFWPFSGDYFVMHIDDEYQHVLVGSPSRDFLWILNRKPEMEQETFERLVDIAKENGFAVKNLQRVDQSCYKEKD